MNSSIRAGLGAALVAVASVAAAEGRQKAVELAFWAGPGADTDARVIRVFDHHACSGRVAIARVESMPQSTHGGALEPEVVVEFSEDGKVLSRWALPIDSIVAAVAGEHLIVPRHEARVGAKALSISTTGSIQLTTVPAGADYGESLACPELETFRDSAYLRCRLFRDLKSKQVRRIGYQGPCT